MLSIAERRKYILDSLNRHGFVRVADMAAEMNVTKATVRKDMEFLESRNLLYRTHGSASPVNPLVQDVSVHVKSAVNSEIKQKIAVEAAGLICPTIRSSSLRGRPSMPLPNGYGRSGISM